MGLNPRKAYMFVRLVMFETKKLIKDEIETLLSNQLDEIEPKNQQVMMMSTILIGVNLVLMVSVGIYWTNPSIHQYLSGRPL